MLFPLEQYGRMKQHATTSGSTTILVVLFTLLILSLTLLMTANLSLTSRKNSTLNRTTLQSQYLAESNLSLLRSHMNDMQSLLGKANFVPPAKLNKITLNTLTLTFCGSSATWASNDTTTKEFAKARAGDDIKLYTKPVPQQCSVVPSKTPAQYELLAQFITTGAYTSILPAAERPKDTSIAGLEDWWQKQLTTPQVLGAGQYSLTPTRVVRLNDYTYRIGFAVSGVQAVGSTNTNSTRVLAARRTDTGSWWVQVSLPILNDKVLMTNHQRSKSNNAVGAKPDISFLASQTFDGPVFTNEAFLFDASAATDFKGLVQSAGCTDLPTIGPNSLGSCSRTASVYVRGVRKYGSNSTLKTSITNGTTGVNFNGSTPRFDADYQGLPDNAFDQKELGKLANGGLTIPDADSDLYIYAGDANGNKFANGTYNATTASWNEPSPVYQYVLMQTSPGVFDTANRYRIDKNGSIFMADVNGVYGGTPINTVPFNGVIYSNRSTGVNVSGPVRYGNDISGQLKYVPPALASFSNLTISAAKGLNIKNDLTMSITPCTNTQYQTNACPQNKLDSENVLGLFTSGGDITIDVNSPAELNLHAALMASTGQVTVTDYANRADMGNAHLRGSLIENWYGAFREGTTHGYGRDFSMDPRFGKGFSPNGFPTATTWITEDASTSNFNLDDLVWQQGSK